MTGFHTCVSRTHNNARYLKMYGHQCSQAITAFATKACLRARNKVAHVELLRGLARPVPRYAVTLTYRNQQRKKQKYKRPRNKPNDGGLWKLAKRNSVRASKLLRFVAITETFIGNQALPTFLLNIKPRS